MRWPFGPPHLTLKPSNKKHQKTKKTNKQKTKQKNKKKEKKKPKKKTAKTPKNCFSVISQIFPFLGGFSKFPFFDTLAQWPRKRAPNKHYKTRGFRAFFLESRCASRNGHFWTKKPKIYKFQLSFFFAYFLLFQKQKTQKSAETPIFIVFLLT